ncbi:MAG: L,D-transpeptidase family protein [Bacillota bacterium]
MKRILCIAVSVAVMVVFSFADVMAVTKAPGDTGEPEAITSEEPAAETPDTPATDVEEPANTEPGGEVASETRSLDGVVLSVDKEGATFVELSWTKTGDADDVTYTVYKNGEAIIEATDITATSYKVTGLESNTTYTFKVEAKSGDVVKSDEKTATTTAVVPPADVAQIDSAQADHNSVLLKWKAVEGADGYFIYRNGQRVYVYFDSEGNLKKSAGVTDVTATKDKNGNTIINCRVFARERKGNSLPSYSFQVQAFSYADPEEANINEVATSAKTKTVSKDPVRALYVTFTPKKSGPAYKTAKGKKKGKQLYKGKRYIAKGFVCSRLRVCKTETSDNDVFFFPRVKAKKMSMLYTTKVDYSTAEAENFVNHKGLSSTGKGKNKLVWISLYTQHAYFFSGSKGNWKCEKDWEVSTGKAMSATATGNWKIFRHWKKRRGLSYWSNFYSQVAMHSWGNSKCFGVPHSGGCVRMTKTNAKWVYYNMPFGTTVCVY